MITKNLPKKYFGLAALTLLLLFLPYGAKALESNEFSLDSMPAGRVVIDNSDNPFDVVTVTTSDTTGSAPESLYVSVSDDQLSWHERKQVRFSDDLNSTEHSPDKTNTTSNVGIKRYMSELLSFSRLYKYLLVENQVNSYQSGLNIRFLNNTPESGYSANAGETFQLGDLNIVSRAGWGCPDNNPSSNYYCDGPFWGSEYMPTTHIAIHHTATGNGSSNWPSVVRAIWDNHAHVRDADPNDGVQGWTDIGYHYLIDPNGVIYEGRYGQKDADARETVTAGHAQGHNRGNIGIALLGTFTSTNISSAARSSLESLIQTLIYRHNLNPYLTVAANSGKTNPVITGHRDWGQTECPGNTFYPTIKNMTFVPADSTLQPVFRFLNRQSKVHFYTADYAEKNFVTTQLAGAWQYENVAYFATREAGQYVKPVHRFLHRQLKIHFYTNDESEKNFVQTQLAGVWQYEGVAFNTFNVQVDGTRPVYRFLHRRLKVHFYTADASEKAFVETQLAGDWQYEFIAYYVK